MVLGFLPEIAGRKDSRRSSASTTERAITMEQAVRLGYERL